MNRSQIGQNFYDLMLDLGEDYTLTKQDGTTYTGKISGIANTTSSYMLSEREYLFTGVATFPDILSHNTFRGCYFKRQINPDRTYILESVLPEPTNAKLGTVFFVQCNETVDLAYVERVIDEKGDKVIQPHVYAENVKVYFDSTLQRTRTANAGATEATLFFMRIPAHYTLSLGQIVLIKAYRFNEQTKVNELVKERYKVESIDMAMSVVDGDNIYGIMDVQMSIDTRA